MIDLVYYSPELRVYRDGRVERLYEKGWCFTRKTNPKPTTYKKVLFYDTEPKLLHRIVAFCFLGLKSIDCENYRVDSVDHIDGKIHNNHADNLRIITHQENMWNTTHKGYYYCNLRNKWKAQIHVNSKNIGLGRFDTEEEARQAYQTAKAKYHVIAT